MNGRILSVAAAVLIALSVPAALSGRSLYVSGGAGFPTGDFGDAADTGWQIAGGSLFADIGTPGLSLGVDGSYGQNSIKDDNPSVSTSRATSRPTASWASPCTVLRTRAAWIPTCSETRAGSAPTATPA